MVLSLLTHDSATIYVGFSSRHPTFSFEGKYLDLQRAMHKVGTPHSRLRVTHSRRGHVLSGKMQLAINSLRLIQSGQAMETRRKAGISC